MRWHKDSITPGELDALRRTAQYAWGHDTCHPVHGGQCYVTAAWLVGRLGGHVGVRQGHYAWLSPDERYVIDLTGDHGDSYTYERQEGYAPFAMPANRRAAKFAKRANTIFDNLDKLLKTSLDNFGDALREDKPMDEVYWHDEPAHAPDPKSEYKFLYGNGSLEVSPVHDHNDLADHAGLDTEHNGPVAVGWVVVNNNRATWETQTNVNVKAMEKIFKDYGKQVGWDWGGITNIEGEPISDEFAPSKTSLLSYVYTDDHLLLGKVSHAELALKTGSLTPAAGWIRIDGKRAEVFPVHVSSLEALDEWASDQGLTLFAVNDNLMKNVEDLETFDMGANSPDSQENPVERQPGGVYQCPQCDQLFARFHQFEQHRREGCQSELPEEHGGFPELNPDQPAPFQPHQSPMAPEIMPIASVKEAARVAGFTGGDESDDFYVAYHYGCPVAYARLREGKLSEVVCAKEGVLPYLMAKVVRYSEKEPKDLLESPVPFIYDIDEDKIFIGQAGQRTSDIPGKFTPGGIVEGTYEPGGKVFIRTMTNMPYTVRHLIELWYFQHPELTVKNVSMRDDAGGDTKLATEENRVGDTVANLVRTDPAVRDAANALMGHGGRVFAVGGAVRDAVMGKTPKDIDLMVTGIPSGVVESILNQLPGRMDITGKDFGVFRYKQDGGEVEIALPRRERSTGDGHRDFEVQGDHTMSPEEDLFRRDFTANAMAVDLSDGRIIDPYNGAADIENKVLRQVNPAALGEDPLRVVRALVAHAKHGLHPDDQTREQMAVNAQSLQYLAPERIQEELDKLMESDNPAGAIRLAHQTGVLKYLLPEVDQCMGYDQNNPHHELMLGDHLLQVLDRMCQKTKDPDLRLAALLHDIGKPDSQWLDPETGKSHFYEKHNDDGTITGADHEILGADKARGLMRSLRYPNDRTERVGELVEHHMFPAFNTEKGARKFIHRVGDHADDLLTLRWADQGGKSVYPSDPSLSIDTQAKLLERVRNGQQATQRSMLAINGSDLIAAGVPQGPLIGQILNQLMEQVIENPRLNQRETLLPMAQQMI